MKFKKIGFLSLSYLYSTQQVQQVVSFPTASNENLTYLCNTLNEADCDSNFHLENEEIQSKSDSPKFCIPFEKLGNAKLGWLDPDINTENYPPWFKENLIRVGQQFANRHFFQVFYSLFLAMLLQALTNSTVRRTFLFSGKMNTASDSSKRFTANFLQEKLWLQEDPIFSPAFLESLSHIRSIHSTVAYKLEAKNVDLDKPIMVQGTNFELGSFWTAFQADIEASNLSRKKFVDLKPENFTSNNGNGNMSMSIVKFNQYDMATATWTFMCLPLIFPDRIHIYGSSDEDWEGWVHLWAVLGWILGVEDKFNIALHPNLQNTKDYCFKIYDDLLVPHLFDLDYEKKFAIEKVIEGIMGIAPELMTKPGFIIKLLEDILLVSAPNMRQEAGWGGLGALWMDKNILGPIGQWGWGQRGLNYFMKMWLRVASLKYFNFDGEDPNQIASEGYFW